MLLPFGVGGVGARIAVVAQLITPSSRQTQPTRVLVKRPPFQEKLDEP